MTDIWPFIFAGGLLGLQGGFAPGPLTALVISEGIRHGKRAGMLAGLAPLMTDGPVIVASLLLLTALPGGNTTLGVIAGGGAVLLVYLGLRGLRAGEEKFRFHGDLHGGGGTVLRAIGVNLLNPNPYLFWFTICAPQMIAGYREHGPGAPLGFVLAFYIGLVGVKLTLGLVAGVAATRLRPRLLMWANRVLSVLMLLYAIVFAIKAYGLIT